MLLLLFFQLWLWYLSHRHSFCLFPCFVLFGDRFTFGVHGYAQQIAVFKRFFFSIYIFVGLLYLRYSITISRYQDIVVLNTISGISFHWNLNHLAIYVGIHATVYTVKAVYVVSPLCGAVPQPYCWLYFWGGCMYTEVYQVSGRVPHSRTW